MSAAVPTAGGAILAAIFAYKSKFPATLFSYHPTLLGIGWLALAPYAIQYVRDSKKATDKKVKEEKVQSHAQINAAIQLCTYGGLFAIYRNKELMAAAKGQVAKHLVSWHGKLGAVSSALLILSAAIAGYKTMFTQKYGLNFIWRDKIHRYLGAASYITAGAAIINIVNGGWGKFNLGGPVGQRAVTAVILVIQNMVLLPFITG